MSVLLADIIIESVVDRADDLITGDRVPVVYVHNYYGKGGTISSARFLAGSDSDESPYGFHLARDLGYKVLLSEDINTQGKQIFRRALKALFGFDVAHAYRNRGSISSADVIWTMTEGEAFAIAFLYRLNIIARRPIITSSVWIINRWDHTPFYRKEIYRGLSKYLTAITVQSKECLAIAKIVFPHTPVELMYFGINTELYKLRPPKDENAGPIRIFAAGTDLTRDWQTLISAFGNDERFELIIYCSWLPRHLIENCVNVKLFDVLTMTAFLEEIARATIVAVPMKENIFSGITFALDATALGKPLLCSRTGGVPTYFDEDDVFYVPVGDATAMRQSVISSTPETRNERARRAQHAFITRDYSTRAMIAHFARLTERLTDVASPMLPPELMSARTAKR